MKYFVLVAVFVSLIVSCSPSTKIVKITKSTQKKPFTYQDGFMSGCGSAFQQRGVDGYLYFKDMLRYQNSYGYRAGWLAGYKKCS